MMYSIPVSLSPEASQLSTGEKAPARRSLSPERERQLFQQLAQGRHDLAHALCEFPPALRVIGRWYGSVAGGSVEAGGLIDVYRAVRTGDLGLLPSNGTALSSQQKAGIATQAARILLLAANGASYDLDNALQALPMLDRRMTRLAERSLEVIEEESSRLQIKSAIGKMDRAKQVLNTSYLPLCKSYAGKYLGRGLDHDDILQEACLGLSMAIERYDPAAPNRLMAFARRWIEAQVSKAVHDQSRTIRLPVPIRRSLGRMNAAAAAIGQEPAAIPAERLAHKAGLSVDMVKLLRDIPPAPTSLDEPLFADSDATRADFLVDPNWVDPASSMFDEALRKEVRNSLDNLKPREKDILLRRFDLDQRGKSTLEELATEYGVTRERIRQIENSILKRLQRRDPLWQYARELPRIVRPSA